MRTVKHYLGSPTGRGSVVER